MHMMIFFALQIYALTHGIQLSNAMLVIMVIYAILSDLLLYSLASQWVNKTRRNVSGPYIHKSDN